MVKHRERRLSITMWLILTLIISFFASSCLAADDNSDESAKARARQILNGFAQVEEDYKRVKSDLADMIRVRLDLSPELLLPDEEITLTVEARTANRPNPTLEIWENCYHEAPVLHTFSLHWAKKRSGDGFAARWKWRPPNPGNYLLRWKCDIGGDIPEFRRNFSVVDSGYAVMILNSTSHRDPRPEPDFHELHLPFSYWAEALLFSRRQSAEDFAAFSRWARQFGDDPGLMIFMGGEYLPGDQTIFYDEPEIVQKTILDIYEKIWPMLGFSRPLKSLYTYGMGNGPMRTARSSGYNLLGALCADQNWGDGPFKINHWGMPARPYFVSEEDFRKPGDGGRGGMVGIQQCERQTVECRDYHCVYSFEAGISYAFDQYAGITRPRTVNDAILSREMDFLQCFVENADQADGPYFFSCGFEFNGVWPEMASINRRFMEYLVRRARDTRIAFTNATAAADFFRKHYTRTPESVLYLPDVFVGLTQGGKPVHYPDTMEIENHLFKAIFRKSETLPYAWYDYTARWNYPDWGNEDIPRKPDGYVIPNTDDRFRVTPRIVNARLYDVSISIHEDQEGTRVDIEVDAKQPRKNLPLALWDLPREYSKGPGQFRLSGAKRFLPVQAPYTHNLCGIIIADLKKGKNAISLVIRTQRRLPESLDLRLGSRVMAKVFERDATATACLYSTGEAAGEVEITLPEGVQAKLYPFDSDEPVILEGRKVIKVEPGKRQRLVGLTYKQLLKSSSSASPVDLTVREAIK